MFYLFGRSLSITKQCRAVPHWSPREAIPILNGDFHVGDDASMPVIADDGFFVRRPGFDSRKSGPSLEATD